jgi:hypothetical protein
MPGSRCRHGCSAMRSRRAPARGDQPERVNAHSSRARGGARLRTALRTGVETMFDGTRAGPSPLRPARQRRRSERSARPPAAWSLRRAEPLDQLAERVLALEQHPLPVGERHERHGLIASTQWVARLQDHDELLPTERLQRTGPVMRPRADPHVAAPLDLERGRRAAGLRNGLRDPSRLPDRLVDPGPGAHGPRRAASLVAARIHAASAARTGVREVAPQATY